MQIQHRLQRIESPRVPAAAARPSDAATSPNVHALGDRFGVRTNGAELHALFPQQAPVRSFAAAFERVEGPGAVARLQAGMSTKPVVLVAGDQLTGKSTVSKALAEARGGEPVGTGAVVRQMAKEQSMSIEDMSSAMKKTPSVDVNIDYRVAQQIAQGKAPVFESRLAGQLGSFLRDLGRENVVSVYLACAPKERALRWIGREIGADVRARLEPMLNVPENASLETCLSALAALDPTVLDKVKSQADAIAARDDNDRARLAGLYGIDYQDRSVFDVVIDTTGKSPEAVLAAVEDAIRAHKAR